MSLPTLTDLKTQTNIASTADDDELADMLDAAIEVVAGIVGPIGDPAEVTETHYGLNGGLIVLRSMPVGELVAISPRAFPGVTTVPYDVADYVLDSSTGILRAGNGGAFYGDITVTYTAGYDACPAAIRLAVLIIAAHLWETQRGTAPSALALQDPNGFGDTTQVGLGFAIPNRAKELLAPYLRPSIA